LFEEKMMPTFQVAALVDALLAYYKVISKVNLNIGRGKNNQGEFKVLFYLLKSDLDKAIDKLQVLGDSSMVINWMKGSLQVQNDSLLPLAQQLKAISNQFIWVNYTHIYREHNEIADQLSKRDFIYLNFMVSWKKYMMVKKWFYNSFLLIISEFLLNL
jgi:ribonuclease HI